MRRTWSAGVVVGTGSVLLAGCTVDQPAEPLAKTLPVAAVLLAVPVVLAIASGRLVWRRLERWPAAGGRDVRRPLAVLPLLAALAYPVFGWLFMASEVGIGFREDDVGFYSWGDAVVYAAFCAVVAVVGGLLALWLGTAIWRERRWALVLMTVAASGALLVQVAFALQPRQGNPAWIVAAIEAAYLFVVGSLLPERRSGVTPPWVAGGDAGTVAHSSIVSTDRIRGAPRR